jgi:hypothetical protein
MSRDNISWRLNQIASELRSCAELIWERYGKDYRHHYALHAAISLIQNLSYWIQWEQNKKNKKND